jgi:hypothetical protein
MIQPPSIALFRELGQASLAVAPESDALAGRTTSQDHPSQGTDARLVLLLSRLFQHCYKKAEIAIVFRLAIPVFLSVKPLE